MKEVLTRMHALACVAAAAATMLAGCGNGSSDTSDTVVVAGDVPIAYVKRSAAINMDPTGGAPSAAGGDLMVRDVSSGSATETNVTAPITQGRGDVSDPEVSYDGKKIVFALKCPSDNTSTVGGQPACSGAWNIWEYDMSVGGLKGGTFRRITSSGSSDDVDPAYLPNGQGFVFSSNRQTTTRTKQAVGPAGGYFAADEYERERVFNLHTMDNNGGKITQISVNQSHDRNPVVRPNGDIMFSRWDHVAGRNHFKVFRVKPDGTDMFVIYGAHSDGNSFLHPRDMDPNGPYAGQISSDLMPLQRTHEGGALVFVDAANYSEQNTPVNPQVAAVGGQRQVTKTALEIDRGISRGGRVTTPYPLWDGTNRVLVAWTACQLTDNGVTKLCDQFTDAQLATVSDRNMTAAQAASAPIRDNARPAYQIMMFDPAKQQMRPVAAPPAGFMYTDPIALQARAEPNAAAPASIDPALAGLPTPMGVLEVRSVYDTDGLGRMGDPVILATDRQNGCANPIPKTTPSDPLDTRPQIADLIKLKDPADPAYGCAPARFIRVIRAVAPPSGMMGLREAIGETDFEPQQILGYAPIEPDGSFKLKVPADTPIGLAVIDAKGRAFQTHTNWIQVRPGETRTCDGCHSPRRGGSINSGVVAQTMPAALRTALLGSAGSLGSLASRRASVDATVMDLKEHMVYTDDWADTTKGGVRRADISLRYKGNTNPADDMHTLAPGEGSSTKGIINYPDHIAPIWAYNRGANTCTTCHNDPAKLDLSATIAGTGRMQSYERLLVGDPVIDQATGLPTFHLEDGVPVLDRLPGLVENDASEGNAMGLSRKSRLAEIMFGEDMASSADARRIHPTPTGVNHATMLTAGEKRVIAEWMDLGGQYYNDLFASGVAQVAKLTQASFEAQVYPIILQNCASSCHQAIGSAATPAGTNFRQNRYVLTGDAEGDFNSTLTMISNVCAPASNYLLSRPSTAPHPAAGTAAILPVGSPNYSTIANWISGGC